MERPACETPGREKSTKESKPEVQPPPYICKAMGEEEMEILHGL